MEYCDLRLIGSPAVPKTPSERELIDCVVVESEATTRTTRTVGSKTSSLRSRSHSPKLLMLLLLLTPRLLRVPIMVVPGNAPPLLSACARIGRGRLEHHRVRGCWQEIHNSVSALTVPTLTPPAFSGRTSVLVSASTTPSEL